MHEAPRLTIDFDKYLLLGLGIAEFSICDECLPKDRRIKPQSREKMADEYLGRARVTREGL
jgi:hypothetical protein